MNMDEVRTYRIAVHDGVDEKAFNARSPQQMTVVRADPAVTLVEIHSDQSGLIGLLRHLHQQGYVLLSVTCEPAWSIGGHNVHQNNVS